MSKYEPLSAFLAGKSAQEVPMSFEEIERVIGQPLPPVAFKHRAWWSNNPSNSVITRAWLEAGYKTERVDMAGRKLVFKREVAAGVRETPAEFKSGGLLDRLRAALGGTVTIAPGVDITAPTGEVWDADRE